MPITGQPPSILYPISSLANTANFQLSVPAGTQIISMELREIAGSAITGGVRIGTTDGGTDVIVAQAVGANANFIVTDVALLKRVFAILTDTPLFIQAVSAWNGASLNVTLIVGPAA